MNLLIVKYNDWPKNHLYLCLCFGPSMSLEIYTRQGDVISGWLPSKVAGAWI